MKLKIVPQLYIQKIALLSVANILVAVNVWAAFFAPTAPMATSVCSNSVTLSWTDSNPSTSGEQGVQVQRSLRSLNKGFSTIASLPAYTTSFTDAGVEALTKYYYRIITLNSSGRKFTSPAISVTTAPPISLSPSTVANVSDTGGANYNVSVSALAVCDWSAISMDPWIVINSGATGIGNGTVTYSVAENTYSSSRTGTVMVASQSLKVMQAGKACSYSLLPAGANIAADGGSGNFTVSTANGCKWTATADVSWLHTSASGTGTGSASYTVDPNTTSNLRTGTISVAGQLFTITQAVGGINVSTSASPSIGGTTSGGGGFTAGESVTVVATPSSCFSFVNWTEGGVEVSTSASYAFTATVSRALAANFAQMTYIISAASSPSAGGSVNGSGSKMCGSAVTVFATANAGYLFSNWTENGTVVSTSNSYSFTANSNRSLMANFNNASFTIAASSSLAAAGSVTGSGSYANGSTAILVATPNTCYNFANWTENGSVVSTSANYIFTVTGNRTLVANFSQLSYVISFSASPLAGGSVSGGGSMSCGALATVSAAANSGYNFVNWTENGSVVSSTASYSFTVNGNRSLVANFTVISATGQFIWSGVFGSAGNDYGKAIAVNTNDNSVVICGSYDGSIFVEKYSASGVLLWANLLGGGNAVAVAVDRTGSIIVAGTLVGTANLGGGALTSAGAMDVFVAKYSPAGVHLWSKRFGGTADDMANAVALDGNDDVVITGYFNNTVDFGGGPLASAGGNDIFVAKYSGVNGTHVWSKRFGSTGLNDMGNGVAVDRTGNIFVTGSYIGAVDFGGGPLTSSGYDCFLIKLNGAGAHVWSKRFGGTLVDSGNAVATASNGDVVVTGSFTGTADFGGGPLTSSGGADIFVARFSGTGSYLWGKQFGSTGDGEQGRGVAVDSQGNIVLTGRYSGAVDFGSGQLMTSNGGLDIFLAKYSPTGAPIWSKHFGGISIDEGNAVTVDGTDSVVATGDWYGVADFGGGSSTSLLGDVFVVKFAP